MKPLKPVIYLLVAVHAAYWSTIDFPMVTLEDAFPPHDRGLILGVALCNVAMTAAGSEPLDWNQGLMWRPAVSIARSSLFYGFVEYLVEEVVRLDALAQSPIAFEVGDALVDAVEGFGVFEKVGDATSLVRCGFEEVTSAWVSGKNQTFISACVRSTACGIRSPW